MADLDDGQAKARPACCDYCCPGCARLDKWVGTLGGYAGTRYIRLCDEARETAGPGGMWQYLEMAQAADEEHAAGAGKWLELANARSARQATRQADAAAAACLQRSAEIQLAASKLLEHPRLSADPDFGRGQDMSSPEVALELRASMGLAVAPPTPYEASMPEVADLARTIGVKR